MSDNTRTVRLSEAKKYIKHFFKSSQPVMLWGPPGVGKSDVVRSIATDVEADGKSKAKLIDMRLSMCEPTDLMGIPYFDSNAGTMRWAPPALLPSAEDGENYDLIILFLDELNGAAPAVQAAAYQLVLDRRVGEYVLPANVRVVAAGNRATDKGVAYRMPKPLENRLVHFEVRVDFNDWADWAVGAGIHPDVVGYLTSRKDDLNKFDPKSPDRSFPTPRSWSFVSDMLQDVDGFKDNEVTDMVVAAIGEGTALQFAGHRKVASQLPDPTLIMKGKVKELKTKEISALYSLATSLAYELREVKELVGREYEQKDLDTFVDNCMGFWMDHFKPEMIVMSMRMIIKYDINIPMSGANWDRFYERHGDLIREA